MIEAINSTLVAAPLTQKVAVQASSSKPLVTDNKVSETSGKSEGFYFSRNVRVDNNSNIAVLEFRNPLNGDVKTQIPTEAQLKAYEVAELRQQAADQAERSGA